MNIPLLAVGIISVHFGEEKNNTISAFHPDYKMLETPRTPSLTLSRARSIAMNNGLRYVYTGNVHGEERGSTYCHACGEKLIGRDWYKSPPGFSRRMADAGLPHPLRRSL